MMNLSENTVKVLSNFAAINSNIVIDEGNVLKTISESKTVLATASVEESFPIKFGIYELNELLSAISLVGSADLTFEEKYISISDQTGRSNIKYFYTDTANLTSPGKDITMPECEVKFELDATTMGALKRAASVLGHDDLLVTADGNVIKLTILDINDETSHTYSVNVPGSFDSPNFRFVFDIKNLKMIDGDYDVNVSSKLISHFVNKTANVEYWCALEKSSTYGV